MKNEVMLIVNNKINSVFLNANRLILTKYVDQINQGKTHIEKIKIIEEIWRTEYSAELKRNNKSYWETIHFKNVEDLIIFKLKFG